MNYVNIYGLINAYVFIYANASVYAYVFIYTSKSSWENRIKHLVWCKKYFRNSCLCVCSKVVEKVHYEKTMYGFQTFFSLKETYF